MMLLGGAFCLAGVVTLANHLSGKDPDSIIPCLFLMGIGIFAILYTTTSRLTLGADFVEAASFFRRPTRVQREAVAGYRRGGRGFVLLDAKGRPVGILDDDFFRPPFPGWLGQVPNVVAQNKQRLADESYRRHGAGLTREDWDRQLNRASVVELALGVVTIGISIFAIVARQHPPALIALLAIMPFLLVGYAAQNPGLLETPGLPHRRLDPQASLLFPVAGLWLRSTSDFRLLAGPGAYVVYPVALLLSVGAWQVLGRGRTTRSEGNADHAKRDRTLRLAESVVVLAAWFIVATGYASSALVELNCLADRGPATVFHPKVIAKVETSRRAHHVILKPWEPDQKMEEISIPRELYGRLEPGGTATVRVSPGRLGWAWYTVAP
jgi:hypothetical protein